MEPPLARRSRLWPAVTGTRPGARLRDGARTPPTIAYIERKTREGKNTREAIRCLKRYLARSLFRALEAMPQTT